MHDVAEDGVAAHWAYRDGVRSNNPFAVDPGKWVAGLKERFEQSDDHDEFLEAVKLEMYSDQVFCFTPKGDVFKLPRGATPIDFAYAIHTRIGSACVGAKIDGLRVPLWTRLKNGQSVEIITAEGQKPEATWMEIAQTGKARSAIRRALREEDTERYIKLGQELARVGFEHIGKQATDKALTTAAKTMGLGGRDTLLAQLGAAQITARDVIQVLFPELAKKTGEIVESSHAVVGLRADQTFRRAGCCAPLPGERIVGISTLGEGVTIHAIDCNMLTQLTDEDSDRWVDLHWHEGPHAAIYDATIELTIANDAGVLGRLCTLIGERGANISNITFEERTPDFYRLIIDVELRDVSHMHVVCTTLDADTSVAHIARMRGDNAAL
jgi:GTP pyrophosphokinase/guanosine-3',5'-bis(diphosphate) 3'-pyrophosphohydrolase